MRLHAFAVSGFAFLLVVPLATQAALSDQKPIRQLVYRFDVSIQSTLSTHSSGIGDGTGGSGLADYGGGSSDKGTISLDVLQVGTDGSLTVQVTENAQSTRSAKTTVCAIYGDGRMVCDPNGKINPEEAALLEIAGRGFFDPNNLDANKHWKVGGGANGYTTSTNYGVSGGSQTGVLDLTMQKVDAQAGAQGYTATTDGTIAYNVPMSIPAGAKEETVMRQNVGMGQDNRIDTQVTLSLISDSLQKKP